MKTNKKLAHAAGLSYLLIIVFGILSHMVIRSRLIVKDQILETANNILENDMLFRISIVSDIVMVIAFLSLGIFLYHIFKEDHPLVSHFLIAINIVGVAMMALNLLNQIAAITILESHYLAFTGDQKASLALLFMNFHSLGYQLATISYGLWLLPMGYLVVKSTFFPKFIGYLLMTGSIGYMAYFIAGLLNFNLPEVVTITADLGEMIFCVYLLFIGTKKI